jgi:anaerobic magnesium-protoporphyrin IX monomethyl ester cyclase
MITLVYPDTGPLEHFIPLGICFLVASLKKARIKVKVLDMRHHQIKDLKATAKKSKFIGFSVMTIHLNEALKLANVCKETNPRVKIIFGGPHPTIFPQETLLNKTIDYVVIGEGEKTLVDLIKNNTTPEKVNGIGYRKSKKIFITPIRETIKNLDEIPFPDRSLFPLDKILKTPPYWPCLTPYPQMSMISTRGCPYNCVYCQPTLRKIFGNITRRRNPKSTVDEIEYLYKTYHPTSIFMADDLFTADKKWVIEVCQEIRKRKLHQKLIWECESRVNTFDDDIAKELRKSGCYMVWFGVESYCQRTLNTLRKGTLLKQNLKAIKLCQQNELLSLEQLMIGNPDETLDDLKATLKHSDKANADITAVAVTSPIPGTDLYDLLVKKNALLINDTNNLGARYKGREKFKLKYSLEKRDQAYDELKHQGEIHLKYLISRSYYRRLFIIRLKSHWQMGNYVNIIIDFGRVVYGLIPVKHLVTVNKIIDPLKGLILKI